MVTSSTVQSLLVSATSNTHSPELLNDHQNNYWALLFSVIPIVTITGNLLVIASVARERSLQTVTNYYIVSLAVADFFVALFVMPFAVYIEVHGVWTLGKITCNIYILCDVGASTASILNLFAISIDRFIAITRPIYYSRQGRNHKRAFSVIGAVWLTSFVIAIPALYFNNLPDNFEECIIYNPLYIVGSSTGSFWIPCIVMTILYSIILKKLRDRQKQKERERAARKPKTLNLMMNNLLKHAKIARDVGKHLGDKADQELASRTRTSWSSSDEDEYEYSDSETESTVPPKRRPPPVPAAQRCHSTVPVVQCSERTLIDPADQEARQNLLSATNSPTPSISGSPNRKSTSGSARHREGAAAKRSRNRKNSPSNVNNNTDNNVTQNVTCLPEYSYVSAPGDTQKYRRRPTTEITKDIELRQEQSYAEDANVDFGGMNTAVSSRSFGEDEFFDCLPFIDAGSRQASVRLKSAPTMSLQALEDFSALPLPPPPQTVTITESTPYGSFKLPQTNITCATPDHTPIKQNNHAHVYRSVSNKKQSTGLRHTANNELTETDTLFTSTSHSPATVTMSLGTSQNYVSYTKDKDPTHRTKSCVDPPLIMYNGHNDTSKNESSSSQSGSRPFSRSLTRIRQSMWGHFKRNVHLETVKGMIPTKKSRKKDERRQIRRERKATHTLAIVLAVFLICWIPFFVCHTTNALWLMMDDNSGVSARLFMITTWLGYMNSCMNPLIYTIFNMEYRRAFKRLLKCA